MQYFLGMISTFIVFTIWMWMINRSKGSSKWESALMSHWDENNTLARRRAEALERIADTLENSK